MPYDEELAARVRQVLRRRTDIAERKMFGGLAFLRHGKMCCGIVGQDLMVRVVEEDMPLALRRAHVRPMDFTGRPLRGFFQPRRPGEGRLNMFASKQDDVIREIRSFVATLPRP
jgi:TfoX-like protein